MGAIAGAAFDSFEPGRPMKGRPVCPARDKVFGGRNLVAIS
jgi:hypothetical protein